MFVNCKSSVWAQELTLYRDRIMDELNKRAGAKVITDVRFSGRGLRKPGESEPEEQAGPSSDEIQSIPLSEKDLLRIARTLEGVEE